MRADLDRALIQLRRDPRHKGLRTKRVQGKPGVLESRIDGGNCLTWEWDGGTIVLRNHCHHDILKKP